MRIAFSIFLSSEGLALMGIRDVGEWKHYVIERFKGILDLTVKNALKTTSPVPEWQHYWDRHPLKARWQVVCPLA
jgi:hypothetical protein